MPSRGRPVISKNVLHHVRGLNLNVYLIEFDRFSAGMLGRVVFPGLLEAEDMTTEDES
ncbi:MAG: hypothetical protein J2P48_21270 [Alphaproteobacteria bacterium]|nr:hypothetical protein [Alphaproteobacteria bacterium]